MEGSDKPGMFVSFESLLRDLSSKLDDVQKAITTEIQTLRTEIASKASKEHVEAVEQRLLAQIKVLNDRADKNADAITNLRVSEGTAKGVSKTTLAFIIAGVGFAAAILSAFIYVIAAGHGGA